MSNDDPFAQYGGAAIDTSAPASTDDPFAKYGGAALSEDQPAQVAIPRAPAGVVGASIPAAGQVPVPVGLSPAGSSPSATDYAKMAYGALTQPEATGTRPGVTGNAATAIHNIGAHAIPAAAAPFVHPLDTLAGAAEATPPGMAIDAALGRPNPVERAAQQFQATAATDVPQAMENAVGDVAGGIEGGRMAAGALGARPIQAATNKVAQVATGAKQFIRPATSPAVVAPVEQAAASLAKAVNPPGGIPEGFEDSLRSQTPGIKDYAARTGNPLNTRWELAKAAAGHGQELNDFYDKEVLGPSADRAVPIEGTGYQGVSRNGSATLGDIDTRLGKINDLLRPSYDKASAGATMTALEKSGLQDEANALRSKLYGELANDTGMSPDEIRQLRQGYGQSYDIASKADAARRRVGPGGPIPLTKEGIIQSALESVQGGRDAIADRGVQSSLQRFNSATSPIAEWQQRVQAIRAQSAAAAQANQAAAQQEFLHSQQLSQDAQTAAATRGQQAQNLRYKGGKAYAQDPRSGWWLPK